MGVEAFKIKRNQLEKFLPDHEAIRQFENLFLNANESGDPATLVRISFETINKNLGDYPKAFNYSGLELTSIDYTTDSGVITKTLSYTSGKLTSVSLGGSTPDGILLTKTLAYTGEDLTGVSYS